MNRALAIALGGAGALFLACDVPPSATGAGPRADEPASAPIASGADIELPRPPEAAFHATPDRFEARAKAWRASLDPTTGELAVSSKRDSLALATVAISRDRPLWQEAPPRAPSLAHGELALARGAVTERFTPRAEGVEQSWTFPERPRGEGDLVVRVRVRGSAHLALSGDEVRAGDLRVRDAAWVDGRGERTPLRVALSGDALLLRVPADLVDRSPYPATLDPIIGPELALEAPIVGARSSAYPSAVALGKDGTALVAWVDGRGYDPTTQVPPLSHCNLYAARVSSTGAVLDPTGILLWSDVDSCAKDVAVAYDGAQRWFAAWIVGYADSNTCKRLFGAVLDEQGKVLSVREIGGGCEASSVTASFDGTSFVVGVGAPNFSFPAPPGGGLYATRVSTAGVPLDALPKELTPEPIYGRPAMACRPGGCLAAWTGSAGKRALRLGANLSFLDATPIALPDATGAVAGVAFDGQSWVVGYASQAAFVAPATGAVTGTTALTGAPRAVAWDGTHTWFVRAGATGQIVTDRVTSAGVLASGSPITLTTAASATAAYYSPTILSAAFAGPNGFVVWEDSRNAPRRELFVTRVTAAGASLDGDGVLLNKSGNAQRAPSVAASSTGYLVGWVDWGGAASPSSPGVYVARLDASGALLDASATLIAPSAVDVAIASDGSDYLVLYGSGLRSFAGNVWAVRVSGATGAVLGSPLQVTTAGCGLALAYDGTQYLAAWDDGATVSVATIAKDASTGVASFFREGSGASLAPGGAGTLIVWKYNAPGVVNAPQPPDEVRGALRESTGGYLSLPTIRKSSDTIARTAAAWDGTQWLVAWEARRTSYDSDVYAARIAPDGSVKAPQEIAIATGPSKSVLPALIGMNDDYAALVAWSDTRNATQTRDYALLGAWVRRSDGELMDTRPITLSDAIGNELSSALAPAGKGRALLVYQAYDGSSGAGTDRIRARFVGSGTALGDACTSDAECVSRSCTDGVCCERPCRGACEACGQGGKCQSVVGADDPDTCTGDDVCSATSVCQRKPGRGCALDSDCTTGHCARGICCDRACDGACEACAPLLGLCTLRSARATGVPSCAPYACDGASATCSARCASDAACPLGTRCEIASGVCVSGASCLDRTTTAQTDGVVTSCVPYTCSAGACRSSCRSIEDCASSFVCDQTGTCSLPPTPTLGVVGSCAASPARARGVASGLSAIGLAVACAAGRAWRRRRAPRDALRKLGHDDA